MIICGALLTTIFGTRGTMHVRVDQPANSFVGKNGAEVEMPFETRLDTFFVSYYPGTASPEDFVSRLKIIDGDREVRGQVSMNKIFKYRHYRFYQAGYDPDGLGSRFSVAHDPFGITVVYMGYLLLFVGMVAYFFFRGTRFRKLLRKETVAAVVALLFALLPFEAKAGNMPKVASSEVSEEFGNLYISYNGRICPVDTYARDFCTKLCGEPSYRGCSATEVLVGWLFFPDTWKPEPMLKIKGSEVGRLLGVDGHFVAVTDFANQYGEYKLRGVLGDIFKGEKVKDASAVRSADEKVEILNSLFTGSALKIFPVQTRDGVGWVSSVDDLPNDISPEQALFVRKSLDLLAEKIVMRQYDEALGLVAKIRQYQLDEGADTVPSAGEFKAEKLYNRIGSAKVWAMMCLTIGILAFVYFVVCMVGRRRRLRGVVIALSVVAGVVWLYVTLCIVLRTVISHHSPLTNGYEIMQALAWFCLLLTVSLQRRFPMALPFGFLISGAALLVSMMGQSNPAVTSLMPVLNSPLLSAHVMVITLSYVLFAFILFNGITGLICSGIRDGMLEEVNELRRISEIMLRPAVFLLVTGIMIGSVWANVSWGRYWGWDPKETCALITALVYALPFHSSRIRWFDNPRHFHLYISLAFLTVLMTYFGANFLFAGLHSYA
ncbi:MAG: cytochrome c biogenesis protein CcsA, partial [Bacteroidales bacterium]|nr:cytochrome c biogenesis protein CcsA [Bacteroidales bacterium]